MGVHSHPGFEAEDYWDSIDTGDRWPGVRYRMNTHTNDPEYNPSHVGDDPPINTDLVYPAMPRAIAKSLLAALTAGAYPPPDTINSARNALLAALAEQPPIAVDEGTSES
jgi:hypothetical protein